MYRASTAPIGNETRYTAAMTTAGPASIAFLTSALRMKREKSPVPRIWITTLGSSARRPPKNPAGETPGLLKDGLADDWGTAAKRSHTRPAMKTGASHL